VPCELAFGTSGRRGLVVHLTQLEVYINAVAELRFLLALPRGDGGIERGGKFYFGYDLRPSSSSYNPDQEGRGELVQAVEKAITDAGLCPENLGRIPTPALAGYALSRRSGCIMVTGSHIPFDRNGFKTYTAQGELLKAHEAPICEMVRRVRAEVYSQPFDGSFFDERGQFKHGHTELSEENPAARVEYLERYANFFQGRPLEGRRILVYQHSSVGRDLLVEILAALGAEAIPLGRSETFVPIDTENVDEAMVATIQALADSVAKSAGPVFAVVSADGDADRPLILAPDPVEGKLRFFSGDLVGMVTAEYLGADAVVVPISCNDAIDRGTLAPFLEPKTRIGSPWVIAGIEKARGRGRKILCGWEPNGGFLLGSDIVRAGSTLRALITRDAVLPILSVLLVAAERGVSLCECFDRLPRRFGQASLVRPFPRAAGREIVGYFSPAQVAVEEVIFGDVPESAEMVEIRRRLESIFSSRWGFGALRSLNFVDGVRITFDGSDVVHFRPSGNADEFRVYAVADSRERAGELVDLVVREPDGALWRMQGALG
jgi:phosphomannomutase